MPAQSVLVVETRGPGLTEITRDVASRVANAAPHGPSLCTLFLRHTSASLLIQENADSDVKCDLQAWLGQFVPRADASSMGWITHRLEGPDDMPAHIKAAHLPVSLSIPVDGGRMCLGTWQGIYVWEHRDAPHRREIVVHVT